MPHEIIPVHKLDQHDEIFEPKYTGDGLSDLQLQFLGVQRSAAKTTFSEHTLKLLEEIVQHEDEVLTATEVIANSNADRKSDVVFRVPNSIPDYDLLALKTQGLIQGRDRAVKLTEAGRVALRDFWLKSGNALEATRKKDRYVVERIASTEEAPKNRKFARVEKED